MIDISCSGVIGVSLIATGSSTLSLTKIRAGLVGGVVSGNAMDLFGVSLLLGVLPPVVFCRALPWLGLVPLVEFCRVLPWLELSALDVGLVLFEAGVVVLPVEEFELVVVLWVLVIP